MIAVIIACALFAFFGSVFLVSYMKSKGQYDEYIDNLDKKEYGFKDFIPIGIYLNEINILQKVLPAQIYKYVFKYNSTILSKLIELHGVQYSQFYCLIHNANKTAVSLLVACGGTLLATIMGLQGDVDNASIFTFIGIGVAGLLFYMSDKSLEDKIKERRLAIQLEFPDFVNKLILLVNAGMTISKAWEKVVSDNKKETSILYTEMRYAVAEIKSGKPEAIAYEEFARRCKIKEIIKFVSVIIMNIKKGGAEVVPTLKVQADECWEMRKSAAKRIGEEASTKVLIPLMIMFVGILIIVATPAVLSFSR